MKNQGAWVGAIAIGALVWWSVKSGIKSKYHLNDQLVQAGVDAVFTVDGIWEVAGVPSYILSTPGVIGDVAYAVATVDSDPSWVKVA